MSTFCSGRCRTMLWVNSSRVGSSSPLCGPSGFSGCLKDVSGSPNRLIIGCGMMMSAPELQGTFEIILSPLGCVPGLKIGAGAARGVNLGRSADFQSAVSRISNPPAPQAFERGESLRIPPIGNRRYSRLETCATLSPLGSWTKVCLIDDHRVRAALGFRILHVSDSAVFHGEACCPGMIRIERGDL